MENGPGLKMYFLLKMVIVHCYVSLPHQYIVRDFFEVQNLEVGEIG